MRTLAFIATLSLLAASVHAQQPPAGMNQADMQRMMQGMQAMQQCMAKIDMEKMERLGQEGEKVQAEVESLCKAGKRGAAQERAMEFGMRVAKDPDMQAMRECSKPMQGMMPQPMPYAGVAENENRHVCDGI
jgi:predicted lipoprotein